MKTERVKTERGSVLYDERGVPHVGMAEAARLCGVSRERIRQLVRAPRAPRAARRRAHGWIIDRHLKRPGVGDRYVARYRNAEGVITGATFKTSALAEAYLRKMTAAVAATRPPSPVMWLPSTIIGGVARVPLDAVEAYRRARGVVERRAAARGGQER